MKKLFSILLILGITISAFSQQKGQRFAIKSGKVEYKLSGNTTGTKVIYWDNYGDKTRVETKSVSETRMFGITNREEKNTVDIIVKDKFWYVNKIDQTGRKGTIPYYDNTQAFAKEMTKEQQEDFAEEILNSLGGEKQGKDNFMGYSCDIISIMGIKSWVYNGVTLKIAGKIMGIETNEEATSFQKNITIPSSMFEPDMSIDYDNTNTHQQQMFGDMYEKNNDSEVLIPVKYPFTKFQAAVNRFSNSNYKKMMVQMTDGQPMAMFMKGLTGSLVVFGVSMDNPQKDYNDDYEKFTHNGRTCRYGNLEDETGSALIVEHKEHNTFIVLTLIPIGEKASLLKIYDQMKF